MTTEYEALLSKMIEERKEELATLEERKGHEKKESQLISEIRFIEVELERYQRGMTLFRTKKLPKVGRWGKPEVEEGHGGAAAPPA